MLQVPPAAPGMREDEIDTPALVIDLDAFESNLDTMAALLAPTGVKLRAHAKTHKSPVIAKLLMARGAASRTSWSATKSSGRPSWRGCAHCRGSPRSRSVPTMPARWRRS
ncbi:MAG: putative amino acid aldolase, partial [Rhodopila sp.]|nr:putative amino acid aldolase [Rhodopila sp.]